jgi:hypothetical protein
MSDGGTANLFMAHEARALLTRLGRVKPFALQETTVPAAAVSPFAQAAVERFLAKGRHDLRQMVLSYLRWLDTAEGRRASPAEAQRRYAFLRLGFNAVLSQFDTFADVFTQRSEAETGVWLSGLDVAAADALALPGYYEAPPVICYMDRGFGAAIRRARTRVPGGGESPVAIIRVPRERMVGSGIASSLVHEVGHQGAALLDLSGSLKPILKGMQRGDRKQQVLWYLWDRWISEILADFWAVARVGISGTLGLMGVVSLPRPFVFRMSLDDPHPIPWVRVKLSCAMGNALYPHPQWARLAALWDSFYPTRGLDERRQAFLALVEEGMPAFVSLLANHRPKSLRGRSLAEVLSSADCQPAQLTASYEARRTDPAGLRSVSPTLAFALIGQARANGVIRPGAEGNLIASLLTGWALDSTLNRLEHYAALPAQPAQLVLPA